MWVENPYWRHFCGETYFQHEPPINPSSLTLWRQRMGEEGVKRLLEQKPKDKNKLYSLHASKVECIGKGKARHPYEFGVKITVTTMYKEGLVVGMRSIPRPATCFNNR